MGESRMLVHRIESAGRPLPMAMALRWMTRGTVRIEDVRGKSRTIGAGTLARWVAQAAGEPFKIDALVRRMEHTVGALEQESSLPRRAGLDLAKPPLYLRSDLSFGVLAGGSVGHIAGVVNELEHVAAAPILITTDDIATVNARVEQHLVSPSEAFWNFQELPTFVLNETLEAETERVLAGRQPALVYQRYSLNNFTGVRVARKHGVPLVIEYNGSEIWMSRHWGRPLKHERLSERIELLNLRAADLVVVVSRAMRDEIVARGIDESHVLVNPNGVDPERYSPSVSSAGIRAKYGLGDMTVVGFIGTFGPWHGAETLARAYVKLRAAHPAIASRVRLLMIGDGATMPEVKRILSDGNALDQTTFAGLVPQEEGASYLAACDVLVSPHVPNADGTPFFGSPTKLFEYMAMGKGIVASNLDQIGEVLEDGQDRAADAARRRRRAGDGDCASRRRSVAERVPRRRGEACRARALYLAHAHTAHHRSPAAARRMRRLLAVSWEMPPMHGPRATQVARTLGALVPLGWTPSVVCLDPQRGGPNWPGGVDVALPEGVEAVRVASPEEWTVVRAAWRLLPALRDRPDSKWVWIDGAATAAEQRAAGTRFDGLVTFAQPWSDHLVGLRVHRTTKLPWVAHFSDPWVDSAYLRASRSQRRRAERMEADVIREADAIVFVTSETADLVMKKYPDALRSKVTVVPHGFDSAGVAPSGKRRPGTDADGLYRTFLRRPADARHASARYRHAECRAAAGGHAPRDVCRIACHGIRKRRSVARPREPRAFPGSRVRR